MKFTSKEISDYYDCKCKSYNQKYNLGYYTHIHTGLYDPHRFPFLFQPDFDLRRLGVERIRYLLHFGQEATANYACSNFADGNHKYVLDCGCGHGGTSIYLAENYGVHVLGVTVSPQQALHCACFIEAAGLNKKVEIRVLDIFDSNFKDSEFDGVIGIDSICQMSDRSRLFAILAQILRPGGKIVMCDPFVDRESNSFKPTFDSYWWSDISTLRQLTNDATCKNFDISTVEDKTPNQIPFWKLSIAHSQILLDCPEIRDDPEEQHRLEKSLRLHIDILNQFSTSQMQYYCVVLTRKNY